MKQTYPTTFYFPGVELQFCNTYRDDRGHLTTILDEAGQVARAYVMVTNAGYGRDMDTWHIHGAQFDRFYVLRGHIHFAFSNGEKSIRLVINESDSYLVTVSPGVYHCFRSYGESWVLNMPDHHYDRADDLRVPFDTLGVEVPW